MTAWTILVEGHQRNIPAKLYRNLSISFWQEDFLSFLYRYIGKIRPAPWQPCFSTNQDYLNNLGRGSPRKHFCQVIMKSVQWFLTRKIFKVFYIDISGKTSPALWRPCFLTNRDSLDNLSRGLQKKHSCHVIFKKIGPVVSDKKIFKVFYIDI